MKIKINKSGFTLIELMISVLLISMLAVMALNSYFNSTATFSFVSDYKNILSNISNARSFAINNKTFGTSVSERYGVCMTASTLVLFADTGDKPLSYEPPPAAAGQPQVLCNTGAPLNDANQAVDKQDVVIKTYDLSNGGKYTASFYDVKNNAINGVAPLPTAVLFFYDKGTGEFTLVDGNNVVVSKTTNKYVILKLTEGAKRTKYIVVLESSGLPEEYDNLNSL